MVQPSKEGYSIFGSLKIFFLFEREREKECTVGEGEAGSPLSKEPDVGLNPRTLGS